MANSAKELIEEHAVIMKVIAALRKQADALSYGKRVPGTQLKETLDLLREFADECHHVKEEKVLFPALAGIPQQKKAVDAFLEEHARGREHLGVMTDTLYGTCAGNSVTIDRFAENADDYCALLTKHIQKENAIFAKVGEMFPDKENERMERAYAKVEKEELGEGKHEKFVQRAEKLAASVEEP